MLFCTLPLSPYSLPKRPSKSPAPHCLAQHKLTVTGHADCQTLLEAALLAAIPIDADNVAGLVLQAFFVLDVLLNAAPEETLGTGGREGTESASRPGLTCPQPYWKLVLKCVCSPTQGCLEQELETMGLSQNQKNSRQKILLYCLGRTPNVY